MSCLCITGIYLVAGTSEGGVSRCLLSKFCGATCMEDATELHKGVCGVTALSVADRSELAVGFHDGSVCLLDVESGSSLCSFAAHYTPVCGISFGAGNLFGKQTTELLRSS